MDCVIAVDLDGTLIPGNSFRLWLSYHLAWSIRQRRWRDCAQLITLSALRVTKVIDRHEFKRSITVLAQQVPPTATRRFSERLAAQVREGVVQATRSGAVGDVTVVLATAAPDFYLAAVAERLGAAVVLGSSHCVQAGWKENMGDVKWGRIREHFGEDIQIAALFTDHHEDLPLARHARRVHLVNPTPRSRALFSAAGVEVEIFKS